MNINETVEVLGIHHERKARVEIRGSQVNGARFIKHNHLFILTTCPYLFLLPGTLRPIQVGQRVKSNKQQIIMLVTYEVKSTQVNTRDEIPLQYFTWSRYISPQWLRKRGDNIPTVVRRPYIICPFYINVSLESPILQF